MFILGRYMFSVLGSKPIRFSEMLQYPPHQILSQCFVTPRILLPLSVGSRCTINVLLLSYFRCVAGDPLKSGSKVARKHIRWEVSLIISWGMFSEDLYCILSCLTPWYCTWIFFGKALNKNWGVAFGTQNSSSEKGIWCWRWDHFCATKIRWFFLGCTVRTVWFTKVPPLKDRGRGLGFTAAWHSCFHIKTYWRLMVAREWYRCEMMWDYPLKR